ncbi:Retrovirus-related Pol polyprotein from transposon opus, partial [Mucuna pruriens]
MVTKGIVLGYLVSAKGIEVDKVKVDIISSLSNPASMWEFELFLVMQRDKDFIFDQPCVNAFQLKKKLTFAPILQALNWEYSFKLMCDASNSALGAILGLRVGKQPHVITYASQTMDPTQVNYTTTEKEFLAIVFSLNKFRSYLLGSKVIVFFDHAALKFLLKKSDAKLRLIRQKVANHLSRLEREVDLLPIRDEFLDEQIQQLTHTMPRYADICNFLVASMYPLGASKAAKERLESDAKGSLWINKDRLKSPQLWVVLAHYFLRHTYLCLDLRTMPKSWSGNNPKK